MSNPEKEDAIINEVLQSFGEWADTIVIGGGYALIIYRLYFNNKNAILPIATRDIDSLLPRKISRPHSITLSDMLFKSGYQKEYKDLEKPPTEAYRKLIGGEDIEIEFLTDRQTRGDKDKNLSISGVVAQPLSYIEMSYENILRFTTNTGLQGNVVDPAAWIFHKLLTFVRRKNQNSKFYKDLYGVWYVTTQLGAFSKEAIERFDHLCGSQDSWFKTAKSNITKWLTSTSLDDWSRLEAQDPTGTLKKAAFKHCLRLLKITK